jgi:hypothetical protein
MLAGAIWQTHETARREMFIFASLADRALKEEQFDRALRFAVQAYPPPRAVPIAGPLNELEEKLAGGSLMSRLRIALRGHAEPIVAVAFSPNGDAVLTTKRRNAIAEILENTPPELMGRVRSSIEAHFRLLQQVGGAALVNRQLAGRNPGIILLQ